MVLWSLIERQTIWSSAELLQALIWMVLPESQLERLPASNSAEQKLALVSARALPMQRTTSNSAEQVQALDWMVLLRSRQEWLMTAIVEILAIALRGP
jgi:F0F1-type ATP synthase gamma subunit